MVMEKKNDVQQINELLQYCSIAPERLATVVGQPQWLVDAVMQGRVTNSTSVNAILNELKKIEKRLSEKKKAEKIANIVKQTIANEQVPQPTKERSGATVGDVDISSIVTIRIRFGRLVKRILEYVARRLTNVKIATSLQKRGYSANVISSMIDGSYVNTNDYRYVVVYCLTL